MSFLICVICLAKSIFLPFQEAAVEHVECWYNIGIWLLKFPWIFSSFHELMQSQGVCRPSVRPSVCKLCANRYFYHRSGWIATKLAHDGPQKSPHPRCAQGQGQGQRSRDTDTFLPTLKSLLLPQTWLDRHQTCIRRSPDRPASRVCSRSRSRSKVTWYGHFCNFTKIASSCRQIAGSQQTCTRWSAEEPASTMCSRSRSRSKVTWYGHFCDVTKCLLYSTVSRSVSTCAHFMKHHYTLLPV